MSLNKLRMTGFITRTEWNQKMRTDMKKKIDQFKYLKLPDKMFDNNCDRIEGIRIDSQIPKLRVFLKDNTIIVADDSWGGLLTIDLDKIDLFVSELLDIQDVYEIA